uniref:FORMYL-COENZYME A TRANSFERASE n=2 Tax=Oxalobacter formigenes TaxID=847 RepID=UPI000181D098|nr:Chain A, FORMYL-COENZYME A TRANSFERASE [Oxalobacter formigenes]2VJK_B Chain B, FORMYL-COENZYME A TRANSFERASE [Oxalobacter formigenes]2VJL_A Chain A, FORMYL-COENZYME A TRANSFERASE [Oxalobacter formigenes]2VJL_B Chain B, FORMYL-COENZYME A TRANSFERASE [Oxalobacter formigenes]2VJM_A Chain A, FORMYL-COENZYME A TRANSFERASE [Oxalobacter formigenes]
MTKPLDGINVLDFTHVQAGPACTQMMGFLGANVIKIERRGSGDMTRGWLQDKPNVDSLYFTMFNCNKRSIELDMKTPEGKELLEQMIKKADVMVENFGPGALDRMGFTWEYIQELNPRVILASVKGYAEGHANEHLKVYENVAQCSGGAAATTGFWDGPPTVSGAALGDSNSGMHLMIGILAALEIRHKTGRGQKVAVAMQDAVLNLVRIKLRDQQRLERTGILAEYPQAQPNFAFDRDGNPLSFDNITSVPRGGNAGGGGQPGWMLKCKGWETDADSYVYFTIAANMWPQICDMIDKPEWKDDPAYNTFEGRVDKLMDIFSFIETKFADKDKFEVTEWAAQYGIPCGPVMSMKELAHDPSLQKVGTVVEVVDEIRGNHLTVGAPFKFSGFQPEITRAPLLGEHTDEVLKELGLDDAKIKELHAKQVV